ncbi:hypothetical protein KJ781_00750 [Patescibacteria group bacterium]|nr:hypothetical protein [Patescibacteria group bacterium]MBU1449010.1 hypothetical protein [Patescibacteria group bacterium]MBU2612841.1 hypothetical protein [Patescibacteria group bacterium]
MPEKMPAPEVPQQPESEKGGKLYPIRIHEPEKARALMNEPKSMEQLLTEARNRSKKVGDPEYDTEELVQPTVRINTSGKADIEETKEIPKPFAKTGEVRFDFRPDELPSPNRKSAPGGEPNVWRGGKAEEFPVGTVSGTMPHAWTPDEAPMKESVKFPTEPVSKRLKKTGTDDDRMMN